jgi:hypothetical protein
VPINLPVNEQAIPRKTATQKAAPTGRLRCNVLPKPRAGSLAQ